MVYRSAFRTRVGYQEAEPEYPVLVFSKVLDRVGRRTTHGLSVDMSSRGGPTSTYGGSRAPTHLINVKTKKIGLEGGAPVQFLGVLLDK